MWIKNCPHKFCYLFSAESFCFGPAIRPLIPTIPTFISGGFLESQIRPVVFINLTSLSFPCAMSCPAKIVSSRGFDFLRKFLASHGGQSFPVMPDGSHTPRAENTLAPDRQDKTFLPSRRRRTLMPATKSCPEINDRDLSRWPALDSIPFFPI